jgi:hypothetical protein
MHEANAASVREVAVKTTAGRLLAPTPTEEAATSAGLGELAINALSSRRGVAATPSRSV